MRSTYESSKLDWPSEAFAFLKTCKDSSADTMRRTPHIPAEATVLIVEDGLSKRNWFLSSLRVPQAYLGNTTTVAIELIDRAESDFVAPDFDLGPGVASELGA
jgi:hypothetical protein